MIRLLEQKKRLQITKKHYRSKLITINGSIKKKQSGRGAKFLMIQKKMLKKLTLIIAEMETGNTSIKMRNMGQTILDALTFKSYK